MKKEVGIAILTIAVICLSIWGYKFLLGTNILSNSTTLVAEYDYVGELEIASPVYINGFKAGVVTDIHLKESDMRTIVVEFTLNAGIRVPKSSVAEIFITSVMGSKAMRIAFDKPCGNGIECADDGDMIKGKVIGMMNSMLDPKDVNGYVDILENGMTNLMDTLSLRVNDPNDPNNMRRTYQDMQQTIANLKEVSSRLNGIVAGSSGKITGIISNLESISGSLSQSNNQIKNILGNVDGFTGELKKVDLNGTVKSVESAVSSLESTLANTDTAIAEINGLIAGLKNGQGSLGQLITNDSLYNNLNASLNHIQWLTQDIRLNPKRYNNLFKRKSPAYVFPADDPAKAAGN
jgi:phospholipid/cholesterol/gamma-HCH transport system substrate-binding protein